MAHDRILALKAQRRDVLDYCADLTDEQWNTPSRAAGWRLRDVIAHMGASCRVLFGPSVFQVMRSKDIERTNEDLVDPRRDWPSVRVLADFARWSNVAALAFEVATRGPLGEITLPLGAIGRYPARVLPCALVFDWHTHLHYDIAPALGKSAPPADERRMRATLEWMLAGMEQMNQPQMGWVDRPITLTLTGLAGGSWDIRPTGKGRLAVKPGVRTDSAACIEGASVDFPGWATRRVGWRDSGLAVTGDRDYAARFLDALNII
ncbi:maleylpyruvate isomerase N-terminal domain-containing protein [Mycobacterium sp.]|uniref:maleylpyruvate isomerase N-terminal domain-containing protein n=1 Tax=Mycobacterium sp. TaxID=1785 RepID=UPI003C74FBEB